MMSERILMVIHMIIHMNILTYLIGYQTGSHPGCMFLDTAMITAD